MQFAYNILLSETLSTKNLNCEAIVFCFFLKNEKDLFKKSVIQF